MLGINSAALLVLGLGLAALSLETMVHAREAGFKAGSPGRGDQVLSADSPIPSNYSQNAAQSTCTEHSGSQMSQSCGEEDEM